MTAVEQYVGGTQVAVRDHQTEAVARLTEWAQSAQAASQIAEQLVRSSFVPEGFRGKPHEATAAILAGLEVGLQPMAALRSFDVIQGQAAARAVTLRAILQSQGHEIELVESTGTRCTMRGRRKGADAWQKVTWTIDRAKQLKLTGKSNWQNQPQAMLVARATSELARLIASDAILGIAYSAEEIADGAGAGVEVPEFTTADPTVPESPTSPAGTRRMSRRRTPPKAAEEAGDDITDAEVVDPDGVTDAQIRKMAVSFKSIDITDRTERLAFIRGVVERAVESSKELTKEEASRVIDLIEQRAGEFADAEEDDDAELFPTDSEAS